MKKYAALYLVLCTLVAACEPLQQAPLVYSSKTVFGADISTPTNEQPGLSLNIGFKNIDAAYVPVAVAKPCESQKSNTEKKQSNCEGNNYKLISIQANNREQNDNNEENNNTKTNDSLSVYGRFNSDTNASKESEQGTKNSMGVGIGKVFATGIAAQNIAKASIIENQASLANSRRECIAEANKILALQAASSSAEKNEAHKAAIEACMQ